MRMSRHFIIISYVTGEMNNMDNESFNLDKNDVNLMHLIIVLISWLKIVSQCLRRENHGTLFLFKSIEH